MKEKLPNSSMPYKIMEIIYVDDYIEELDAFPLYEILPNGVAKETPGTKKTQRVLVFDVENASSEFKAKYASIIHEIRVKDIKRYDFSKKNRFLKYKLSERKTLLSLSSPIFETLSSNEIRMLGNDYYTVEYTENGIKLEPVIVVKGKITDELYLAINLRNLDKNLEAKITPNLLDLMINKNGLYEQIETRVASFDKKNL